MPYRNHKNGHGINRVTPNNPSSAKAVRYNQSVQCGNGPKGIWATSFAPILHLPADLNKVTDEKIQAWVNGDNLRQPTQKEIDLAKWFNTQYNCGWNI